MRLPSAQIFPMLPMFADKIVKRRFVFCRNGFVFEEKGPAVKIKGHHRADILTRQKIVLFKSLVSLRDPPIQTIKRIEGRLHVNLDAHLP